MKILYDDADNLVELDELRNDTNREVAGTVGTGSTTTSIVAASLVPPPLALDEFATRTVRFDDATLTPALRGRAYAITSHTLAGVLTVPTMVAAPVKGDIFKIIHYLNAATVAVTLKDSAGVNITGETWPKTLAYVAGSNGRYRATLSDLIGIVPGQPVKATVTAEQGGLNRVWEDTVPVQRGGF
ncbi:MAG: hypothetical protein NUV51_05120 [Sulfuricaulis sp.]|nr:hypothetical protein [Sulfuricaulis sp.]